MDPEAACDVDCPLFKACCPSRGIFYPRQYGLAVKPRPLFSEFSLFGRFVAAAICPRDEAHLTLSLGAGDVLTL